MIYYAKTLFSGIRVNLDHKYKYVAVPEKKYKHQDFDVIFNNKKRSFNWKDAETYRVFEDKFGRGNYTLGYFNWDKAEDAPQVQQMGLEIGMSEHIEKNKDKWEELREKLHKK